MGVVRFTKSAQVDLLDAWMRVADESLASADRILDALESESNVLALQPLMGQARSELGANLRSWPTWTPYILFYLADSDGITVIRVLHHARDTRQIAFS